MKLISAFGFLILFACKSAWALQSVSPNVACDQILDGGKLNDRCHNLTYGASFDRKAVGLCVSLPYSLLETDQFDFTRCIATIRNQTFDPFLLKTLSKYSNDIWFVIDILHLTAGKYMETSAIAVCDKFDLSKDCVASVAGKRFTSNEIAECSTRTTEEGTNECFSKCGKKVGSKKITSKRHPTAVKKSQQNGKKARINRGDEMASVTGEIEALLKQQDGLRRDSLCR